MYLPTRHSAVAAKQDGDDGPPTPRNDVVLRSALSRGLTVLPRSDLMEWVQREGYARDIAHHKRVSKRSASRPGQTVPSHTAPVTTPHPYICVTDQSGDYEPLVHVRSRHSIHHIHVHVQPLRHGRVVSYHALTWVCSALFGWRACLGIVIVIAMCTDGRNQVFKPDVMGRATVPVCSPDAPAPLSPFTPKYEFARPHARAKAKTSKRKTRRRTRRATGNRPTQHEAARVEEDGEPKAKQAKNDGNGNGNGNGNNSSTKKQAKQKQSVNATHGGATHHDPPSPRGRKRAGYCEHCRVRYLDYRHVRWVAAV